MTDKGYGKIVFDKGIYTFQCPHCKRTIEVDRKSINCKIFRHGVYKSTLIPIDPHTSKETCDLLLRANKIYGCSKPFYFDGTKVSICDYI